MQAWAEHYITLRQWHVGLVTACGSLFVVRAFAALAGAGWPLARPARVTSWALADGPHPGVGRVAAGDGSIIRIDTIWLALGASDLRGGIDRLLAMGSGGV